MEVLRHPPLDAKHRHPDRGNRARARVKTCQHLRHRRDLLALPLTSVELRCQRAVFVEPPHLHEIVDRPRIVLRRQPQTIGGRHYGAHAEIQIRRQRRFSRTSSRHISRRACGAP